MVALLITLFALQINSVQVKAEVRVLVVDFIFLTLFV